MIIAGRVYQKCHDLFEAYPLAVAAVNHAPTTHSMVLMLADGADVSFFVVVRDCGDCSPIYTVSPWHAGNPVIIECDGADVPDPVASAVMRGVPVPREGSLFGWVCRESVTALLVVYAMYAPDRLVPTWSVMPLVGTPEERWPPFTAEHLFGHWFWDNYRAGAIIDISGVIAATAATVFWLDTYATIGSDSCIVACDVRVSKELILPRGAFVGSATLRAGVAVRTVDELLGDVGKIDLAPRFRVLAPCN